MIKTVTLGAIGVRADSLDEALDAAKRGGFAGLDFSIQQVVAVGGQEARRKFETANVQPAVFGVPFDWRGDVDKWETGLQELPSLARAASEVGCRRCATWIMPASNELAYDENLAFHVGRLKPIAEILGTHGISFGLEFVGPKTLRDRFTHEFIYTAEGMLDMAGQVGPTVGLLLDSFHWFTSHGTIVGLQGLTADQVVYVHINDGVEGRTADEQIDGDRRLPGATGVIDISGFLSTLAAIGFDGPVACEPFYSKLAGLATDDERLHTVKESVDKVFGEAGQK